MSPVTAQSLSRLLSSSHLNRPPTNNKRSGKAIWHITIHLANVTMRALESFQLNLKSFFSSHIHATVYPHSELPCGSCLDCGTSGVTVSSDTALASDISYNFYTRRGLQVRFGSSGRRCIISRTFSVLNHIMSKVVCF